MTKTERLNANLLAYNLYELGMNEEKVIGQLMEREELTKNDARNIARSIARVRARMIPAPTLGTDDREWAQRRAKELGYTENAPSPQITTQDETCVLLRSD